MGFFKDVWNTLVVEPTEMISGVTAAEEAGAAQQAAMQQSIDFQREMMEQQRGLLNPYVEAGEGALQAQQALTGALGPEAQAAAYQQIQNSPGFQSALQQGETSILQNASATGGLRGGNVQGALAQYSPQLLSQAIDQRYSQLGGLTNLGQASAAGVGAGAMGMGQSMGNQMAQMGQAQASNILGQYNLQKNFVKDVAGMALSLF